MSFEAISLFVNLITCFVFLILVIILIFEKFKVYLHLVFVMDFSPTLQCELNNNYWNYRSKCGRGLTLHLI